MTKKDAADIEPLDPLIRAYFVPDGPGESVPKSSDMVPAVLDDPGCHRRFEEAGR